MGWGTHPDTLAYAYAQGVANRSSFKKDNIEWLKIFRDTYYKDNDKSESLLEYIKELDERIKDGEAKT